MTLKISFGVIIFVFTCLQGSSIISCFMVFMSLNCVLIIIISNRSVSIVIIFKKNKSMQIIKCFSLIVFLCYNTKISNRILIKLLKNILRLMYCLKIKVNQHEPLRDFFFLSEGTSQQIFICLWTLRHKNES